MAGTLREIFVEGHICFMTINSLGSNFWYMIFSITQDVKKI